MTRLQRWKLDAVDAVRRFDEVMRGAGKLPKCSRVSQFEWHALWERWQAVRPRAPLEEWPGMVARPFMECLYASHETLQAFRAWVEEDDGTRHECNCSTCDQRRTYEAKLRGTDNGR